MSSNKTSYTGLNGEKADTSAIPWSTVVWGGMFVLNLLALAFCFYFIAFTKGNIPGGDQHQWNDINRLTKQYSRLSDRVSNLENNTIDCGLTCTDGTIVITDLEVNNTIFARIGGA
ncbi:MAG: hypothetical protein JSS82_12665, partial [Bacteroidetes bacterium]|nr:hypothetical protein [Bacteroidota bacterium]